MRARARAAERCAGDVPGEAPQLVRVRFGLIARAEGSYKTQTTAPLAGAVMLAPLVAWLPLLVVGADMVGYCVLANARQGMGMLRSL